MRRLNVSIPDSLSAVLRELRGDTSEAEYIRRAIAETAVRDQYEDLRQRIERIEEQLGMKP